MGIVLVTINGICVLILAISMNSRKNYYKFNRTKTATGSWVEYT